MTTKRNCSGGTFAVNYTDWFNYWLILDTVLDTIKVWSTGSFKRRGSNINSKTESVKNIKSYGCCRPMYSARLQFYYMWVVGPDVCLLFPPRVIMTVFDYFSSPSKSSREKYPQLSEEKISWENFKHFLYLFRFLGVLTFFYCIK